MLRRLMMAGAGSSPPATYATLNPDDKSAGVLLSGGDLIARSAGSDSAGIVRSTVQLIGKRYFEATIYAAGSGAAIVAAGVANATHSLSASLGYGNQYGWAFWGNSTGARHNGTTALPVNVSGMQVIGVAVDADAGKMWLRMNGSWMQGDPAAGTLPIWSNLTGALYAAACPWAGSVGAEVKMRFDPSQFSNAAPAGFLPVTA